MRSFHRKSFCRCPDASPREQWGPRLESKRSSGDKITNGIQTVSTCPDMRNLTFSDEFLRNLTRLFEPPSTEVEVLAGSLTCQVGRLLHCLPLAAEA